MDASNSAVIKMDDVERVSCLNIEIFALNERQSPNSKYNEIKESISKKGVQQPLHIVFHPAKQDWVLSQGGQTRLRICQELYRETGEEQYLFPPIVKTDFASALDLCINHLVENELRGETSFLQKARAIFNIPRLLTENDGAEPTQEDIASQMANRGMPIRRQSITAMLYAVEALIPNLTNKPFVDSLSRKTVEAIRVLRKDQEDELSPDDFDQELITFANAFDEKVTIKTIKEHFLPSQAPTGNSKNLRNNKDRATQITGEFGLGEAVEPTEELTSGFLVRIPDEVKNKKQALILHYQVSLSGACNGDVPDGVLDQMGLGQLVPGSGPSELTRVLLDRLDLSAGKIMGIPFQIYCDVDETVFESLMRLIAGVRTAKFQTIREQGRSRDGS